MANNQNINKVVYAGTTLIDLTGDDVTAGDVLSGKKFHLPSGAEATGTLQVVNRNLLDNWDFVGGGSQLGEGQGRIGVLAKGAKVLPGKRFSARASERELKSWIDSLPIDK